MEGRWFTYSIILLLSIEHATSQCSFSSQWKGSLWFSSYKDPSNGDRYMRRYTDDRITVGLKSKNENSWQKLDCLSSMSIEDDIGFDGYRYFYITRQETGPSYTCNWDIMDYAMTSILHGETPATQNTLIGDCVQENWNGLVKQVFLRAPLETDKATCPFDGYYYQVTFTTQENDVTCQNDDTSYTRLTLDGFTLNTCYTGTDYEQYATPFNKRTFQCLAMFDGTDMDGTGFSVLLIGSTSTITNRMEIYCTRYVAAANKYFLSVNTEDQNTAWCRPNTTPVTAGTNNFAWEFTRLQEPPVAATTAAPTTAAPTTVAPTTAAPTTVAPTTAAPTTVAPTTAAPTTVAPTTAAPTTVAPTTAAPTTVAPTTAAPTTAAATTAAPTTAALTTAAATTAAPTTAAPTTAAPTTAAATTAAPTTAAPTTAAPTTAAPTTAAPTTAAPTTAAPTTAAPTTAAPTNAAPTTAAPTTAAPTTAAPTTAAPTTAAPTTAAPTTAAPTTAAPTTAAPVTTLKEETTAVASTKGAETSSAKPTLPTGTFPPSPTTPPRPTGKPPLDIRQRLQFCFQNNFDTYISNGKQNDYAGHLAWNIANICQISLNRLVMYGVYKSSTGGILFEVEVLPAGGRPEKTVAEVAADLRSRVDSNTLIMYDLMGDRLVVCPPPSFYNYSESSPCPVKKCGVWSNPFMEWTDAGGRCRVSEGDYTCICAEGITGDYCTEKKESETAISRTTIIIIITVCVVAFVIIVLITIFLCARYSSGTIPEENGLIVYDDPNEFGSDYALKSMYSTISRGKPMVAYNNSAFVREPMYVETISLSSLKR